MAKAEGEHISEHQHVIPSEAEGPAYSASADRRIPYSVF
jgi:hypothetical protein